MRTSWIAVVLLAAGVPACTLGMRPQEFRPAMGPAGILARVTLDGDRRTARTIAGELLAATDSGVIVLTTDRRILHVFWAAARRTEFRQLRIRVGAGTLPDSGTRERLRLVSRFPHGMSEEVTRQLLAPLGRDRVEIIRPHGTEPPTPAGTSAGAPAPDSVFLARARSGSARYHALDSAIADGFRRIGGDFPGMGEHWVHTGRLMSGTVDPASPAILSYASIAGRPALLGVAYAVPLAEGEPLPAFPRDAWHGHAGTVDEASFLPHHAGHGAMGAGARIAVLHAWVWLENPDGPFATDNPALPFARAGLPPSDAPAPALRALALAHGAIPFYSEAIARGADLEPGQREAVTRLLASGAARARAAIGGHATGVPRDALATIWDEVWDGIAAIDRQASEARNLGFALQQP